MYTCYTYTLQEYIFYMYTYNGYQLLSTTNLVADPSLISHTARSRGDLTLSRPIGAAVDLLQGRGILFPVVAQEQSQYLHWSQHSLGQWCAKWGSGLLWEVLISFHGGVCENLEAAILESGSGPL